MVFWLLVAAAVGFWAGLYVGVRIARIAVHDARYWEARYRSERN